MLTPTSVKINGDWYSVSSGGLSKFMEPIKYKLSKPHPVLHPDYYQVELLNGGAIGTFDVATKVCTGSVENCEASGSIDPRPASTSGGNIGTSQNFNGLWGCIGAIFIGIGSMYKTNWGGKIGIIIGIIFTTLGVVTTWVTHGPNNGIIVIIIVGFIATLLLGIIGAIIGGIIKRGGVIAAVVLIAVGIATFFLTRPDVKIFTNTLDSRHHTENVTIKYVNSPDGTLNVRSGPSAGHEILFVLTQNATVKVLDEGQSGNWVKIEYQGGTGFVNQRFLSDSSNN